MITEEIGSVVDLSAFSILSLLFHPRRLAAPDADDVAIEQTPPTSSLLFPLPGTPQLVPSCERVR